MSEISLIMDSASAEMQCFYMWNHFIVSQ